MVLFGGASTSRAARATASGVTASMRAGAASTRSAAPMVSK
jgi:hypothetical protein